MVGQRIEPSIVSKKIIFQNGLNPGESQVEPICFKVGDIKDIYTIENIAENQWFSRYL